MVIVLMPTDAIAAHALGEGLRRGFGLGAALLPFLLLGWATTFFIKQRLTNSPLRLAIALGIIYLAIISILGALTPLPTADLTGIFDPKNITAQGGYLGGAIAWALLTLTGFVITLIILIGLIIIGLILIGFSITGLVERIITTIKGNNADKDAVFTDPAATPNSSAYNLGPGAAGAIGAGAAAGASGAAAAAAMQPTKLKASARPDGTLQPTADLGATRRRKGFGTNGGGAGTASDGVDFTDPSAVDTVLFGTSQADASATADGTQDDDTTTAAKAKKSRKGDAMSSSARDSGAAATNALTQSQDYELPSPKVLRASREKANTKAGVSELRSTGTRLQDTLEEFGVDGQVVGWIAGPTVTLYKVSLGEGVRLNRVTALQDDIQLALAAQAIRIVAPIPGTSLVGIEVPNADRSMVLLGDVLPTALDPARNGPLALAIGKDVEGESILADLSTMPHLLIGGTTGSGKSVAINAIIMSILMRTTPTDVRMIMIDPKRVELTLYNGIPHLYVPVITDANQAASALSWCVAEMDRRLKLFEKHAVKNIKQFNAKVATELEHQAKEQAKHAKKDESEASQLIPHSDAAVSGEIDTTAVRAQLSTDLDRNPSNDEKPDITVEQEELRATLPYLVIVIDELADLMMLNGKEVEATISRLAQLARAAGLHLIVATQRPSTNVITGLIKANIVNRIAFTVASGIDSRVILDTPGAEDLIGLGDLLFSRPEYSKPVRIQGCFVSEPEIETVVDFWRSQGEPEYHESILETATGSSGGQGNYSDDSSDDDPLLWEAAEIVVSSQLGSTSAIQRRLKVGYARAGRIMDMLENKGIVGQPNGSKPRDVLVDDVLDLETLRAFE
jgi:S-DNA-T family DNA segregation ATPase FtsK/SpoIIIE